MEKQSLLTRVSTVRSLHRTRLTTGTALWLGLLTMLWAQNYLQRTAPAPRIEMVPPSSQTLTAILQQNYDHKLAAITAALSEGTLLPTEQAGIIRHTVQPDDTLWRLTRMYQVDAAAITISNGIDSQTPLNAGDVLLVPRREGLVHRVASGETLEAIANRYQVRQADIIQATPLTDRDFLRAGQTILIPGPIPRLLAARNGEPLPPVTAPATEADPTDTATAASERPADAATEAPSETEAVIAALPAAESAPRVAATLPPTVHVVRTGDTLEEIAIANNLTVAELRSLNPNIDPRTLQLGQELITAAGSAPTAGTTTVEAAVSVVIPPERHAIQSGDTLEAIAIAYGMTIAELQRLNPNANPRNLQLGQELIVTGTPQVAAAAPIAPPVVIEAPPAPSVEVPVVEVPAAEAETPVAETSAVETVETPVAATVVAEPEVSAPAIPAPEPLAEVETSPATETPVIEVPAPPAISLAALPEPEIETRETEAAIAAATPTEPVAELEIEPEPEPIAAALPPLAVPLPPRDPSAPPLPLVAPLARPEVLLEPEADDPAAEAVPEAPAADLPPLAVPLPPPNSEATPLPLVAALPPPPPTPDVSIEPPPPEVPPISEGFVWPVDGVITSGYGWRWGRIHAGVDIPGPIGSPIVAVQSGTVIFAGWHDGGYGLMVEVRHDDRMVTRYAHGNEIFVSVGQAVNQGHTIMARGSTGWSTGPHLHLEVLINGEAVDPVTFLP